MSEEKSKPAGQEPDVMMVAVFDRVLTPTERNDAYAFMRAQLGDDSLIGWGYRLRGWWRTVCRWLRWPR